MENRERHGAPKRITLKAGWGRSGFSKKQRTINKTVRLSAREKYLQFPTSEGKKMIRQPERFRDWKRDRKEKEAVFLQWVREKGHHYLGMGGVYKFTLEGKTLLDIRSVRILRGVSLGGSRGR